MNVGGAAFLAVAAPAMLALPRRHAVVPLLLTAAYTGRANVLEVGPANLSALRILILVGFVRTLLRGERLAGGVTLMDGLLILWAVMLVGLSAFHTSDAWNFRIGMTLGELGVYFLCRILIQDLEDVRRLFGTLCIALMPLAVMLMVEKATGQNAFGVMGSAGLSNVRDGHVRAYGPFAHPILAGTVGATCLPMALAIWRTRRLTAMTGLFTALGIVVACTSSGPVMMTAFSLAGLAMWSVRHQLRLMRWTGLAAIVVLELVMNDPVYFLMAKIDITGSSTGWHRAALISSSIDHLGEWWLTGTDYTRHWMPTGIHANAIHTDITNHLLGIGVLGGVPLMLVFIVVLILAFRAVGRALAAHDAHPESAFLAWTLGAMLFGQVMNFWSISLFDQSISFLYLNLAAIAACHVRSRQAPNARIARRRPTRHFERPTMNHRLRPAAIGAREGIA